MTNALTKVRTKHITPNEGSRRTKREEGMRETYGVGRIALTRLAAHWTLRFRGTGLLVLLDDIVQGLANMFSIRGHDW